MRHFLLVLCGTLFLSGAAQAQVTLGASCEGDSITIGVEIFNNAWEDTPLDYRIVVYAEYVGTCAEPILLDHPELPFPPYLGLASYSFKVPNIDYYRYFLYRAVGVDPDGNEFPVFGGGDVKSYGFAGCEDAVMIRGWVTARPDLGGFAIDPCPDSCWTTTYPDCMIDFTEAEPGWEVFVGMDQVLDFYGRAHVDGMPGAPCAFVSRVVPVTSPEGCGAVPTNTMSWGTLKSSYR